MPIFSKVFGQDSDYPDHTGSFFHGIVLYLFVLYYATLLNNLYGDNNGLDATMVAHHGLNGSMAHLLAELSHLSHH